MVKRFLLPMLLICFVCLPIVDISAGTMEDLLTRGIHNNDLNMVKTAIVNGADVNKHDSIYKRTPLSIAIGNKNADMVKYLIENGANVNLKAANHAISFNPSTNPLPPLSMAAILNELKIAQLLFDAGAEINTVDSYGNTPLIEAISKVNGLNPNLDMVVFLLSSKADVNKATNNGITPLIQVIRDYNSHTNIGNIRQKKIVMAKVLLELGADPNKKDKNMKTALDYAIDTNFKEMIDFLLPITKIEK